MDHVQPHRCTDCEGPCRGSLAGGDKDACVPLHWRLVRRPDECALARACDWCGALCCDPDGFQGTHDRKNAGGYSYRESRWGRCSRLGLLGALPCFGALPADSRCFGAPRPRRDRRREQQHALPRSLAWSWWYGRSPLSRA